MKHVLSFWEKRTWIISLALLCMAVISLNAHKIYAGEKIPGPSGSLNVTCKVLAKGNSLQLVYSGGEKVVSWKSKKKLRASVSAKGKVKAAGQGKVVVQAVLDSGAVAECTLTVRARAKSSAAGNGSGHWKNQYGERYYVFPDGSMLTGVCPVGDNYYFFDTNGALQRPAKTSVLEYGKKYYLVSSSGKTLSGWQVVGKNLYYAGKNGAVKKDTTYEGISFGSKGAARKSAATTYQKTIVETVNRICTENMSKGEKLYACWRYLTGRSSYSYYIWPYIVGDNGWVRKSAWQLLETGRGDCYNFACAFAAMAGTVGYEAYVVYGRVSGSRDHAADGLTRHAWVKIYGLYYDPEAEWAGWYRGVYGDGSYDIRHQTLDYYLFSE